MIMNQPARNRDLTHLTIDSVVGSHQAFLDRSRVSNDLESRAGLINILERAIGATLRLVFGWLIRIKSGRVGQGENLTGMRIHNDRSPGLRMGPLDGAKQGLLRAVLDRLINGKHERLAGMRLYFVAVKDATLARAVALHKDLA